jgi:glycosyltransferase involved in cell wall biosynthesis
VFILRIDKRRNLCLRLTIVQYAGDYREAFQRFSNGGKETYYAQRYSVDFVGRLAQRLEQVAVVCAVSDVQYDLTLPNGVRAIGAGLKYGFSPNDLLPTVVKTQPTRLSVTTPLLPVLRWANRKKIRTIVPLADSFLKKGLRRAFQHKLLAHYLNRPIIDWVGNHGIRACLSLVEIGVNPAKIIPWDWPPSHRPSDYSVRALNETSPKRLLYVGSITQSKGVADLLHAMALLRQRNVLVTLSVVGRDPDGSMINLAKSLQINDLVDFVGVVPNEDIPSKMRDADAVVVPSRHEYPEGLPLTIYEALAARTPIVASDHRMFSEALVDGESAIVFAAGNIECLAKSIEDLLNNPDVYRKLSANTEAAWNRIQLPVRLGNLIEAWIADDARQSEWIKNHSIFSGYYGDRIG